MERCLSRCILTLHLARCILTVCKNRLFSVKFVLSVIPFFSEYRQMRLEVVVTVWNFKAASMVLAT
jgi:hypothetical protein